MVLVDTSVWIRFLANRAPFANTLDALLGRDEVAGHELVYGELLIGDRAGRVKLLAAYGEMHQASTVPHSEVVAFVRNRALFGRELGGSTFTCWRPPSSGNCSYGLPTPGCSQWQRSLELLTRAVSNGRPGGSLRVVPAATRASTEQSPNNSLPTTTYQQVLTRATGTKNPRAQAPASGC